MSGLAVRAEEPVNGVDVREQGNSLRVASNTPHLVSLGTGRLSTAVTLHPIKQGRVTIGSDPTCDIYVAGTGVSNLHCHVENSHGVVTLYPVNGSTLLDGMLVDRPTRLSQGSMLTIGRSNYLRFNHPEEAKLMKSVMPTAHLSMAPIQFQPNEECVTIAQDCQKHHNDTSTQNNHCYQNQNLRQKIYKDNPLTPLDHELEMAIKDMGRRKPPVAPRKPYRDLEFSDSNSDNESQKPKVSSIMAKVSKFEYYAKAQQKSIGRSQFYTTHSDNIEISPKVFTANSLTVNTPAKDVLGGKNAPTNYVKPNNDCQQKVVNVTGNNMVVRSGSYANVAIRNKSKIDDIVKNFDDTSSRYDMKPQKKVNNDQQNVYGKINNDHTRVYNQNFAQVNFQHDARHESDVRGHSANVLGVNERIYEKIGDNSASIVRNNPSLPSPSFDRNPQYSPVYANSSHSDRSAEAESRRVQAYQERIKEEEVKVAENARLDEILNMCAEYERQIASGIPITPTEKRSQNKIITNGSLPRSIVVNNPNFIQTSEGYYKFDTSHSRNNSLSQSLPTQRNLSSYENFDITHLTPNERDNPQQTHENPNRNQSDNESPGRMDEIGIPVFEECNSPKNFPITELSSPIMIRKLRNQNGDLPKIPLNMPATSPMGSPYENLYYNRNNVYGNLKPKSPNTQSPRTRIKTSFAHKNLPSPQYFIFPTPPPVDNSKVPDFDNAVPPQKAIPPKVPEKPDYLRKHSENANTPPNKIVEKEINEKEEIRKSDECKFGGIEKQLSLEEEIPMIDDSDLTDDIEFRYSKVIQESKSNEESQQPIEVNVEIKPAQGTPITKNKSFDDVKKELMADIPELEEFEKDLKESNNDKMMKNIAECIKAMDLDAVESPVSAYSDDNVREMKHKYDVLKEERKKLLTEIHEYKCKMSEIRSQEDDILRELEMEKALIKGEYDSEIAILNIEQKKKVDLMDKAKKIEEEMRKLKEKQETRQNELSDRVEIATLKVERIERDLRENTATLEELQNAQDILDNETKIFEDLEFQHLEEESEMLANREDLQNEIVVLSKKIEAQKTRILTLKSEANDNLTSALDETKILQAEYVRLLNNVEELTVKLQVVEKELKPLVSKLNDIERAQSPDSAFYTDQTRAKSGEFGYSPQSSDSDDLDLSKMSNFDEHRKEVNQKFNSIDQMSQSMIVDIGRRDITDLIDDSYVDESKSRFSESPTKSSGSSKEKKGFWERNFDSLSRLKGKEKKSKSPPAQIDIMSQSLNENMFYNNDNIESDTAFDRFNSLRLSKSKKDKKSEVNGPTKSSSSSKIPTFAALGKIMKKDSFAKKNKENVNKTEDTDQADNKNRNRYVKNNRTVSENKYNKSKSLSPDKTIVDTPKSQTADIKDESPNQKGHNVTFDQIRKNSKDTEDFNLPKIVHRKSCGDEPGLKGMGAEFQRISDSGKIPSQDDIDRISKVTMDAPILSSDTDMNSLGRRTLDSFMELERKRVELLEEQGCQVIENEREKISELKRRVQDETKKLWDEKVRSDRRAGEAQLATVSNEYSFEYRDRIDLNDSIVSDRSNSLYDRTGVNEDCSYIEDPFNMTGSTIFEESSGVMSSSVEELQVRNSRTDSLSSRPLEDDKRSDDSRPLSNASDFSRDNILSGSGAPRRSRRGVSAGPDASRPLTRYLPVDRDDFDLRRHIETAGHQVELCPHVNLNSTSCRGYLHKLGAKFHAWSKRWFVFDRETKTFVYYWDRSEKKPRGGAYFQVIEEVYLDHGNTSKSPNPQTTFVVKTRQRRYYLMAPSGEAARIWIDVIFTGAQGYTEYLE